MSQKPSENCAPGQGAPAAGSASNVLRDGFWERTEIVRLPELERPLVRKSSKGHDPEQSPWARESLRREIRYLQSLSGSSARWFPPIYRAWGHGRPDLGQDLGYEIPFFDDCLDASARIKAATSQIEGADRKALQSSLAQALFNDIHEPVPRRRSLTDHIGEVLTQVSNRLGSLPEFQAVIEAEELVIQNQPSKGLNTLLGRLQSTTLLADLDAGPWVRLHGDLILENILCSKDPRTTWELRLLIDPVSVAGIAEGPPLFDLVKYESYASGELPAFRNAHVTAYPITKKEYHLDWSHDSAELSPYRDGRWHLLFRKEFEACYGPINWPLYHLLEAYFSLVMALNTVGTQRWARVLKGLRALHLAVFSQ